MPDRGLAIVGYDGSPVAASTDPLLTMLRQPMHEQGVAMAGVLVDLRAGAYPPRRKILDTELVVCGSA